MPPSRIAFVAAALAAVAACGGQEPPPKATAAQAAPRDPDWLAQVAETCAKVSSCATAHDAPRVRDPGACVDAWIAQDPTKPSPLHRCLVEASSCTDVRTCMHGGGDARAAAFCAQRQGVVSGCDGERLVSCNDEAAEESTVTDCAALGASCREVKTAGGLVMRACWSPQKCPAGAPESRCDGPGGVLSCHDGAVERVACGPGTRCEEHKDEAGETTASCELAGRLNGRAPGVNRCGALGTRRCEGDRLVECHGHFGNVDVSDCEASGLRCAGAGPRAACYVPANVECDHEMLPTCEAGALVFCAAGRIAKIACERIGMGPCSPAARGPASACTPRAPSAERSVSIDPARTQATGCASGATLGTPCR